jgi:hypothetical protein
MWILQITIVVIITLVIISLFMNKAYAIEQVLITSSTAMKNVIFDGKWSFFTEWKPTSLNEFKWDDGTTVEFRSAHQDNFIYFLIDDVSDTSYSKVSDRGIICLGKNETESVAKTSDYCFVVPLGGWPAHVLQGGSPLQLTGHFKEIPIPDGFIGIGNVSDENDRYTPIPHASYEFRVPTSLVGRSDVYRLYVGVYHTSSKTLYSWPTDAENDNPFQIPAPNTWGEMFSPDKSLPEFQLPLLVFLVGISLILCYSKVKGNKLFMNIE